MRGLSDDALASKRVYVRGKNPLNSVSDWFPRIIRHIIDIDDRLINTVFVTGTRRHLSPTGFRLQFYTYMYCTGGVMQFGRGKAFHCCRSQISVSALFYPCRRSILAFILQIALMCVFFKRIFPVSPAILYSVPLAAAVLYTTFCPDHNILS